MMVSHEGAFKPVGLQGYRQGWSKAEPLCMAMVKNNPVRGDRLSRTYCRPDGA